MSTNFEYLIIGAGPAGLQLGYYLEKSGREYRILESGEQPGVFFRDFPRHRKLISINKYNTGSDDPEFNMRFDWNSLLSESDEMLFKHYSKKYFPEAENLVDYLRDYAQFFQLKIDYETTIERIEKKKDFLLTDSNGNTYSCKYLVIATGVSKPYIPEISGIELTENYSDVSVDPDDFINQKVLIIGKGNSGFEMADGLMDTTAILHVAGPKSIKMAWKTHYVGNLRAVNNNLLDTYQLKSLNAVLDVHIDKIEKRNDKYYVSYRFVRAEEAQKNIEYDRVITCTGFSFDNEMFSETCKPNLCINDRFPEQTNEWESSNIDNMYFAGVLMHMRDFKKSTSGFIHGFRYNIRALHHMLECKNHKKSWPHKIIDLDSKKIMKIVIDRVNKTSALWQQFGFLADLIVISKEDQNAKYYEELPVDYIHNSEFGRNDSYYVLTLEYGPNHDKMDPFDVDVVRIKQSAIKNTDESHYLHPVLRHFKNTKQIREHHIVENLENEWFHEIHTQPLEQFFKSDIKRIEQELIIGIDE
ncbi:NAD(P)-binding domain-containing protein [Aquimarina longa]|uniref:NAD(P)-binding domain-containing protein n=1 Tax=Aquimarina longa TaxID=1080221 RepID=UPI000781B4FF|nr:NAD(P)-binding domain-containing protein [Aquimarina longa]